MSNVETEFNHRGGFWIASDSIIVGLSSSLRNNGRAFFGITNDTRGKGIAILRPRNSISVAEIPVISPLKNYVRKGRRRLSFTITAIEPAVTFIESFIKHAIP